MTDWALSKNEGSTALAIGLLGLAKLNRAKENFDLILMDTYMPIMNGLEAIQKIREGHLPGKENIPIISFSAGVLDSDQETARRVGADDIIGKPFKIGTLHEKITRLVKK